MRIVPTVHVITIIVIIQIITIIRTSFAWNTRFLSGTLLPFLFWGLLIKNITVGKGYPYYIGP